MDIPTTIQGRNTAIQNEVARLYLKFENDGVLTNPASQPLVEIIDADGVTILDSLHAQEEYTGVWFVDWFVPKDLPVGTYHDNWIFQWSATASVQSMTMPINVITFNSFINFTLPNVSHQLSGRVNQMLLDLKNFFIYEATHIPIYAEQAKRVQQEDQQRRVVNYYYLALDRDNYIVSAGDTYLHNGIKYTVVSYFNGAQSSSSSSSSLDSSSTSSIDSSSSSSSSSEGVLTSSSSSSNQPSTTTTTTTLVNPVTPPVLTVTGVGNPLASGILSKISGNGSNQINFTSFTSKKSKFSTVYNLAYRNWCRDFKPIVHLNDRIVDDGWYTDYDGRIYFDRLMSPEDVVHVDYKFSCFSTEQLLGFLRMGLKKMNAVPPASTTASNLRTMPIEWDAPVLLYGAATAMRRAVFALQFQEKAIIFGHYPDYEHAKSAAAIFQSLYQDYSKEFDQAAEDAKSKRLPGIGMFVTPEYTLPGGRSRWFRYLFKTGSGG